MPLTIQRLTPDRRDDFYRVHCEGCDAGWCFCVAWWVRTWDGWGERSAEQNRTLREELFARGESDGYILYDDGAPVGWCQCARRDRFEKLVRQFELTLDPECWAVTCLFLMPVARGSGYAHRLLEMVLDDLTAHGVTRVQAFPRRGHSLPSEDVWTGPEAIYRRAGFTVLRDDPVKPVLEKRL